MDKLRELLRQFLAPLDSIPREVQLIALNAVLILILLVFVVALVKVKKHPQHSTPAMQTSSYDPHARRDQKDPFYLYDALDFRAETARPGIALPAEVDIPEVDGLVKKTMLTNRLFSVSEDEIESQILDKLESRRSPHF